MPLEEALKPFERGVALTRLPGRAQAGGAEGRDPAGAQSMQARAACPSRRTKPKTEAATARDATHPRDAGLPGRLEQLASSASSASSTGAAARHRRRAATRLHEAHALQRARAAASACGRRSSTRRRSARRAAAKRSTARPARSSSFMPIQLVHDDLPAMDNDDLRRGRPTCHRAFDEATAILAGDALQALAFELLATHPGLPPSPRRASRDAASCSPTPAARAAWPAARPSISRPSAAGSSAGGSRAHAPAEDRRADPGERAAGSRLRAGPRRPRSARRSTDSAPRSGSPSRSRTTSSTSKATPARSASAPARDRATRQADLSVGARASTRRALGASRELRDRRAAHCARTHRALGRIRPWRPCARVGCWPDGTDRRLRVNFAADGPGPTPFRCCRAINSPGRPARARPDELGPARRRAARIPDPHASPDAAAISPPASARSSSPSRCTMSSTRRDDRLVWDVGHQAYPHKVLTGRRDRLDTIKQNGGLAPFPDARRKRVRHLRRRPFEHLDQRRARHGGRRRAQQGRRARSSR